MTTVKVQKYDVVVNGVKTTLILDEAGAKRYGVWKGKTEPSADGGNKAAPAKKAAKKAG